ncbi:iron-containing alcohol dehydrogenase [Glaciecola punicea ACAM 611]|uniref:Iron-containing alcohol dehydrogenase n=1 Tax=Glaciecola punicea ACAM 611 TaxID=1121923 RepID=H5TDZ5_9ALTE|nr:iron-containing alcohol dehydrogenase [Glaciecola punicea]OFA31070.1 alcohol dehydrogenase [Glaciecola punicea]GAB56522.1 iron-containing alcohol dehydrogenase [Glaciecola punicea ACAM 611]
MSTMINLPSILQIGAGAINELPAILRSLSSTRPFLITDSTMVKLGLVATISNILEQQDITLPVFSKVMPEPDEASILAAVNLVATDNYDSLIALGGGSAIDSAKAIALLASHGGSMRDYKVPFQVIQQSIPVIAIPTTAGTGSECTRVTIISDSNTSEKMLCMGPGLMPKAAIVDYELTLTAPFRITADTGIDALTHAIEAFVSKKSNLYSDQQAIAAMKLIAPNLLSACLTPSKLAAKEAMMLGASLAGIAFSNASVGLVHGMSRPLGVHFHVPHGMSNAMLLPAITQFSLSGAPEKYAQCAVHMGLISSTQHIAECHTRLTQFLTTVNTILKVPMMSEFGIVKQAYEGLLETMANQALASGSVANNPNVPNKDTIIKLYRNIYA